MKVGKQRWDKVVEGEVKAEAGGYEHRENMLMGD